MRAAKAEENGAERDPDKERPIHLARIEPTTGMPPSSAKGISIGRKRSDRVLGVWLPCWNMAMPTVTEAGRQNVDGEPADHLVAAQRD